MLKKWKSKVLSVVLAVSLLIPNMQLYSTEAANYKTCKGTITAYENSVVPLQISKTSLKVTWKSTNTKVAKIGGYGKVGKNLAVKKTKGYKNKYRTNIITGNVGTATILAITSKKTWSCKIKVSHKWKITEQTEATSTSNGKIVKKCSCCGKTKVEELEYQPSESEDQDKNDIKEQVEMTAEFKHSAYMIKVGEIINLADELAINSSNGTVSDGEFYSKEYVTDDFYAKFDTPDGSYKGTAVGMDKIEFTYQSNGEEKVATTWLIVTDDQLAGNNYSRYPDDQTAEFYQFLCYGSVYSHLKSRWDSGNISEQNIELAHKYKTLSQNLLAESKDTEDYIYNVAKYICKTLEYGSSSKKDSASWRALFGSGLAICQGYAESFYALMYFAGVPVYCAVSTGNPSHEYNFVYLEDGWYGIDITSMDTFNYNNDSGKLEAAINWRFYLAPIDEIITQPNHYMTSGAELIQLELALPHGTKYSYYRGKKTLFLKSRLADTCTLGHNWDSGTPEKPLDCTWFGNITYTCKDCGYQEVRYIDYSEHQYDDGVICESASCTHGNIILYTCKVCGATKQKDDRQMLEHDYSIIVWMSYPTTSVKQGDGVYYLKCSNCGRMDSTRHTMTLPEYIQLNKDNSVVQEKLSDIVSP